MSKLVIALGGNALGITPKEQHDAVGEAAKNIVDLVAKGNSVVVTHGNGPQVGMIYNAMEADNVPFAESGAMSQGYIGYQLQQALKDELDKRKMKQGVATVVTQVLVDAKDPAFKHPTKPVGRFMSLDEAEAEKKTTRAKYIEDAGRGYRRVVASPMPKKILELDTIEKLLETDTIVIACGGGGVPVVKTRKDGYEGIDAVIDKDRTSAILAKDLHADGLIILTAIDKVYLNYNTPEQIGLDAMKISDARVYSRKGEFADGSMLPKIEACSEFVKATGKMALIASLNDAAKAIDGKAGTLIYKPETKKAEKVEKKKRSFSLSAFTIIMLLIFGLAALTYFLPKAEFDAAGELIEGSGVVASTLPQVISAPIKGFADAIDICIYLLVLGAFLKIVDKTKTIETGIRVLIRKLHGKELILIPILMFLFSIGGTTYGMLEETVGFYALLAATMVAAGMDTVVSSAIVLLGAGVGVLGSTINPFAVGVAVDAAKSALPEGTEINQMVIIGLGAVLWITAYLVATGFVMLYARKVIKKKGSTILSLQEQRSMEEFYGDNGEEKVEAHLSKQQKITLLLFALTFVVMIIGFIPWEDFGMTLFADTAFGLDWFAGLPLGQWYFQEVTIWFLVMTIVIGIVNKMREKDLVDTIIDGADDMVGVVLIIALARGASVLMSETHLDNFLIYNAAEALRSVSHVVFAPLNYVLHLGLSVLIPSSSGLATLSAPIMAPLAQSVGYSVEVTLMEMVAANGLVNLFTPTCAAIMGGLALAKVEYTTWLKWAAKIIIAIAILNIIILTVAMLVL